MQTAPEHGSSPAPATPQPLFRIDPGWPFVIAGLLLLVAGVLIPAERDLRELRNALEVHRALEDQSIRQLAAYDRFLNDLKHGEPQLVERLAASQLNLMPKDERSMLAVPTLNATVTQWIDESEPANLPTPAAYPDTLLSRLATGPRRLWVLASGVFLVFVGLMLSPSAPAASRRSPRGRMDVDGPRAGLASVASAAPAAAVPALAVVGAGAPEAAASGETSVEADPREAPARAVAGDAAVEQVGSDDFEVEDVDAETADSNEAEIAEVSPFVVGGRDAAAAHADAACMAGMTRASEVGAAIVELKPSLEQSASFGALPIADSLGTPDVALLQGVDGVAEEAVADAEGEAGDDDALAHEARAETASIPGEIEVDADAETDADVDREGACEEAFDAASSGMPVDLRSDRGGGFGSSVDDGLPAATDRALDSRGLFDAIGEDRWISTRERG